MTDPLVDPVGRVLVEIRDDAGVNGWADGRVRGGDPAPKTLDYEGDALGAGHYKRFITMRVLGRSRQKRLPVQEVRVLVRCYGLTAADAGVGLGLVSAAIHARGPRITGTVGIWNTWDDGGDGYEKDPDTKQPYESLIVAIDAATSPIA